MDDKLYAKINDYVMATVYSPLLLIAAYFEKRSAKRVRSNRRRGEEDDDHGVEEWEQMAGEVDFEADGWGKLVEGVVPNVESDEATCEVRALRSEVGELREMLKKLVDREVKGSS